MGGTDGLGFRTRPPVPFIPPILLSFAHRRINVAPMSETPRKSGRFDPPLAAIQARQMGELVRGESRWDVLVEVARDEDVGALRGRVHFVSGIVHRISGWIFLEWAARDIEARFAEFSAQELWNLLDSLA